MSVFAPDGGTLKSTNIPAAFMELCYLKKAQERIASTEANPINNTTITTDEEAQETSITATVDFASNIDGSTGNIVLSASNDLSSVAFDPGTSGTLKKTIYAGAVLELAQLLANAEAALATETNRVTITHADEEKTTTITATIPYTVAIDTSGKPVITATDYLG